EAVLARPDLPSTRRHLGDLLVATDKPTEAVPHLRAAVQGSPFDMSAALALFQACGKAGDGLAQRRLAARMRVLHEAAPEIVRPEPWIMNVPPPGDELVSIIILCCNEVAYTKLCLESVFKHSRAPYELILVD